jgi:hypothetical protein
VSEDRNVGAFEDHIGAAENWLVQAEEARSLLTELEPGAGGGSMTDAELEPGAMNAARTAFYAQASLTAVGLADLHRKMAETYANAIPQRIAITQHPEAWLTRPVPDGQGGLIDASAEAAPCDCCVSLLFSASTTHDEICADCGHSVGAHNDPSQQPETGIRLSDFTNPQGTSLADLGDDERRSLITILARSLPSEKPKAWRSPGGAGQWNG